MREIGDKVMVVPARDTDNFVPFQGVIDRIPAELQMKSYGSDTPDVYVIKDEMYGENPWAEQCLRDVPPPPPWHEERWKVNVAPGERAMGLATYNRAMMDEPFAEWFNRIVLTTDRIYPLRGNAHKCIVLAFPTDDLRRMAISEAVQVGWGSTESLLRERTRYKDHRSVGKRSKIDLISTHGSIIVDVPDCVPQ